MDADAVNTDGLMELLAKATPGPWAFQPSSYGYVIVKDGASIAAVWPETLGIRKQLPADANARLIAAAVNTLPALLDRQAAVEAELAALRADAERARIDAIVLRNLAGAAYRGDVIESELRKARQEADAARLLPDSGEVQPPHDDGEGNG